MQGALVCKAALLPPTTARQVSRSASRSRLSPSAFWGRRAKVPATFVPLTHVLASASADTAQHTFLGWCVLSTTDRIIWRQASQISISESSPTVSLWGRCAGSPPMQLLCASSLPLPSRQCAAAPFILWHLSFFRAAHLATAKCAAPCRQSHCAKRASGQLGDPRSASPCSALPAMGMGVHGFCPYHVYTASAFSCGRAVIQAHSAPATMSPGCSSVPLYTLRKHYSSPCSASACMSKRSRCSHGCRAFEVAESWPQRSHLVHCTLPCTHR